MPCPQCRANGKDKTGNHLMLFEDGGAYCNRCGLRAKWNGDIKRPEIFDISMDLSGLQTSIIKTDKPNPNMILKPMPPSNDEIKTYPFCALSERNISEDAAKFFGVRCGLSMEDGSTVVEHYYPYVACDTKRLHGYKVRKLPKSFYSNVSFKGVPVQFFGQHKYSNGGAPRKLLVVSGECDAMAAWDMFKAANIKWIPAIVSFPQGETYKPFRDNKEFIDKFEEIIYCPDQDKTGKEVIGPIAAALGNKLAVMEISEKDPNDMLYMGKQTEFINAFYAAKRYKPHGFVNIEEELTKAKRMPEWGLSFPWDTLTRLTYGRRVGEGYYIGAGVKVGKSSFVNELLNHMIYVDKLCPCLIKTEEEPNMTFRKIASVHYGIPFHKPDANFTQEQLDSAINTLPKDSLKYIYDYKNGTTWEDVKEAIRYAVQDEKCRDVLIDPITAFTDGMPASDVDIMLKKISRELAEMAKDLGFTYYVFCHLNAPPAGAKPHEEGGRVKSNQFAGSRGMMRACHYMIGIERDTQAEDEETRNQSTFVLLADRMFGNTGRFPVYFNKETERYLEKDYKGDF